MADIGAPTLVLHGTDDPMFPLAHGEALAAEIPGATLLPLDGMGHEVPPPQLWDVVVPAIVRHTGS
jgi:pimeloyl-ACP methyl ester carboxylesterase